MNSPRILAAIAAVMSVVLKTHLTIAAAGLVISVSLPAVFLISLATFAAVLFWLVLRSACGFRSSPYLRTIS